MKEVISTAGAPAPAGPYSPGLIVGDWIFLSGQGGFDPGTDQLVSDDIAGQTAQVFRNIETLLHSAGAGLDDVVSCLVCAARRSVISPAQPGGTRREIPGSDG
jgi:2-iminobutanoate/2-iminopropanoate deaminase